MGLKWCVLHFAMRDEKPIPQCVPNLHLCAVYSITSYIFSCSESSRAADNTVELIVWVRETCFHYKITRSLFIMLAFLKK